MKNDDEGLEELLRKMGGEADPIKCLRLQS